MYTILLQTCSTNRTKMLKGCNYSFGGGKNIWGCKFTDFTCELLGNRSTDD